MRIADTSFLVAFFDADDRRHQGARAAFAETNPVVIGVEVLVETLGVLKAKAGREAADGALEDLMKLASVEWATEADVAAAYKIYRDERSLSFVDATVIQNCVARGVQPLTFDQRQAKVARRRVSGRA